MIARYHKQHAVVVFHTEGERSSPAHGTGSARYELHKLFGQVSLDGEIEHFVFEDAVPGVTLDDAKYLPGEWVGIFHDAHNDSYIVKNDHFGFQPIYLLSLDEGDHWEHVVGNSFEGIVQYAHSRGRARSINWPNALSALWSMNTMFSTAHSGDTPAADVITVRPDVALHIERGGVSTVPVPFFEAPGSAGYQELIARGVDRGRRHLTEAAAQFDDKVLFLSGGRDSRIVLAMLAKSGLEKEFSVSTADPRKWDASSTRKKLAADLRVASALKHLTGMPWLRDLPHTAVRTDFAQSLHIYQGHRSARNYGFVAHNRITHPASVRLELRGGGGELLKNAYLEAFSAFPFWQRLGGTHSTVRSDAGTIFQSLVDPRFVQTEIYEAARNGFVEDLTSNHEGAIGEALRRHYVLHRNPCHFGHLQIATSQNAVIYHPLAQPELLWAAGMLSAGDLESKRLSFDLLEELGPRWNDLPFDDGFWPEELLAAQRRNLDAMPEAAEEHGELDEFFETSRVNTELVVGAETHGPSSGVPFDAVSETKKRLRESLWRLHDHANRQTLSPAGIDNLMARAETSPGQASTLLSKIATCLSVAEPTGVHVSVHRVRLFRPRPTIEISTRAEGTACWVSERPPANEFPEPSDTLDLSPALRSSPASFSLAAGEDVPSSVPGVQFAFYLYKEDVIAEMLWYQDSSRVTFDVPRSAGRWRGHVFVKFRDRPDRIDQMPSNTIEVAQDGRTILPG